jgi:NitT/TauT family transport system ATP-binding protein
MIRVHQVRHEFAGPGHEARPVIENVSVEIADGEFVAIVGPSGCGKTTLLNLVAGLENCQQGEITVYGAPPAAGDKRVGYMLARDSLLPWRRALGNAELALEVQEVPKPERRDKALRMLAAVGLDHAAHLFPAQLSQGMRQRVALARVFAPNPQILLLDEPFSALDAQTKVTLQDAFLSLWEDRQATVVLVTHDLAEAVALADRVVLMTRGPGRVRSIYDVKLPRPRSASGAQSDPVFHQIYEAIWADLKEEVSAASLMQANLVGGAATS